MFRTIYDAENKIWKGKDDSPMYHKDCSVGKAILKALKVAPFRVNQISDNSGKQVTNGELLMKTIRASMFLINHGIKVGDVIGFVAKNSENIAPIAFASLIIGAPLNPIDPSFIQKNIAHMFNLTKPKIVFCDAEVLDKVQGAVKNINLNVDWVTFVEKCDGCLFVDELFAPQKDEMFFVAPEIGQGDKLPALIQCSSGTTGPSKGVELSHAQVLDKFGRIDGLTVDDKMLSFSSLYWVSGSGTLISATLAGVTRIITTEPYSLDLLYDMLERHRFTLFMSAPSQLVAIINSPRFHTADWSCIKLYVVGGAAAPIEYLKRMSVKLTKGHVATMYGLTETGGIVTANMDLSKGASAGTVRPGYKVKIVNDCGEKLGVNEDGEICIKTIYPFLGYSGMPEAINVLVDSDGWLHSGDIGHMDEDGHLYIVDRIKDIIKYNGHQISPTEMEHEILKINGVDAVCVVGIPCLAHMYLPTAVVVLKKNCTVTEKEIQDFVKENMGYQKQLAGGVYFIESLPMTPSGKCLKQLMLQYATKQYEARTDIDKS